MTATLDPLTRSRLAPEIEALATEFDGTFGIETIERYLAESLDHFGDARVQTFLPIFVRRFACDRLRALAQSTGAIVTGIPEVLFVCVHNAGRSQMAAALLAHHAQGRVNVRSAGSAPASQINAAVVRRVVRSGLIQGILHQCTTSDRRWYTDARAD